MLKPVQVIGVGDADMDILAEVDHVPRRDDKVRPSRLEFHPGGMVANFVCALSRLGTSCAFHGPLGDDEFGRTALDDLQSNGVDTSSAVIKGGGRTYSAVIMLDATGEKAALLVPSDCMHLGPDELSEEQIARAGHLHTVGSRPTTVRAIGLAKKHGLTVSVDLESPHNLRLAEVQPWSSQVDILFINERTLKSLTGGTSAEETAAGLVEAGTGIVCLTMGASGSLAVSSRGTCRAAAFRVPVADSTGAGDCYAAGFVHGFLQGWPLNQTVAFASAVAALAITQWGGHSGAPTLRETLAFLDSRGFEVEG